MTVNIDRILSNLGSDYRVIDVSDHILGRASSIIAKRLLNGEKIVVVNVEKSVITGNKRMILERYKEKYDRGSKEKGPYFPRHPEKIFKRTVRGMLPWKSKRGREAYKRLRVFMGIPELLKSRQFETIDEALLEKVSKSERYVTLAEISKFLGFKGV